MKIDNNSDFIPFRFPVLVEDPSRVIKKLINSNVQTRRFFYPMHLQPALKKYKLKKCVNSQFLYEHGLCLPVHRKISRRDIKKIVNIFNSVDRHYGYTFID